MGADVWGHASLPPNVVEADEPKLPDTDNSSLPPYLTVILPPSRKPSPYESNNSNLYLFPLGIHV